MLEHVGRPQAARPTVRRNVIKSLQSNSRLTTPCNALPRYSIVQYLADGHRSEPSQSQAKGASTTTRRFPRYLAMPVSASRLETGLRNVHPWRGPSDSLAALNEKTWSSTPPPGRPNITAGRHPFQGQQHFCAGFEHGPRTPPATHRA
jgi:hypothetical protein